ncbi:MAG: hypothetical protein IT436_15945 [Phycisphaerales bacterium]|nr:hypothetical protein [Phycisphaerales bacterium]
MTTDVETLARKLEPLMPGRVKRWLEVYAAADPGLRGLIERQVRDTARRALGHAPWLLSLPPERVIKGAYHLGTVLYEREKWPAGLQSGELLQGLAVFGRAGSGKSNFGFHLLLQLAQRGVPFLFLDWKRTGRHLLPLLGSRVGVYTPGRRLSPFPFDPFQPPPGVESHAYAGLVADQLAAAYTLGDGAVGLLQKALSTCLDRGRCTLTDLIQEVEQATGHARLKGWQASALRALRSLEFSGAISDGSSSQRELVHSLLHRPTIVELDALPGGAKRFLVPLLCLWVYHARMGAADRERLRFVIVVEEAHQVLYPRPRGGQETVMEMLLRQCRELGIAMIVIDQHPHLISSAALGNTYATVCFNLKDPADVAKAAAMTQVEAEGELAGGGFGGLPVGHAVIKLQDRWRRPFLVRFPKVAVVKGSVSDERLSRWMAGHTDAGAAVGNAAGPLRPGSAEWGADARHSLQVRRVPPADRPLSDVELSFIEDVLVHSDDGVKARYRRLGLSGHTGHAIKQRLVREGWLEASVVPVGRSSRKVVLRPTRDANEMLGLAIPDPHPDPGTPSSAAPRGDGILAAAPTDDQGAKQRRESLAHEYWKRVFAQRLDAAGYAVSIEAARPAPSQGFADVVGIQGKSSIAVEVETGRSDVVANARLGLLGGYGRVVVAVTDRAVLGRVESDLARAGLLVPGRVEVVGVWEPWALPEDGIGSEDGAAGTSGGGSGVRG